MSERPKLWPVGELPMDWRRPELEQVKELGYTYDDPRELVTLFENKIAEFAGSKYAVAVDNCTDAIFLSLKYYQQYSAPYYSARPNIAIPSRCYVSIPMIIENTFHHVLFEDNEWHGVYQLKPYGIWDGAARFTRGMYKGGLHCLSFQIKKILPIGKGGMILTDDAEAASWLRIASFEGRHLHHRDGRWQNEFDILGWNMYMPPEDAGRGLILFDKLMKKWPDGVIPDCQKFSDYPDLSKAKIFLFQ